MGIEEYKKWISEAWNDFKMADVLLNSNIFNGSVFHSQQAVEKAIKALLYYHKLNPWGHSIIKLMDEYVKTGNEIPKKLKKYAKELDGHYTTSRYPDSIPETTPKDAYNNKKAQSIYKKAKSILDFINKKFQIKNGEENDADSC